MYTRYSNNLTLLGRGHVIYEIEDHVIYDIEDDVIDCR